jgi:hypothetical protein
MMYSLGGLGEPTMTSSRASGNESECKCQSKR